MVRSEQHPKLDLHSIRQDFPILSRTVYGKPLVYLDNAATTHKPNSVIRSLTDYYENYNSNVHRGVHALSAEATDKFEEARVKIAGFINSGSPEEIIWTRNATEAINLVAATWPKNNIQPGDEIVLSVMEHHSNLVPWQKVAADHGAILKFFPITNDGTLDLENIDSLINERTKLLTIVHSSNSLGTINPVKMLASKAKSVGAAVMIDGAQSVPHMPVDVIDIDCDFLALSGHKMLGPTGIGALYVKRDVLEEMEPFLRGGEMVLSVNLDKATWNDLPMKFEAGTPDISGAIGLAAAVEYLEAIGMDAVRNHEIQLTSYALNLFDELENVLVYGPRDISIRSGVISFSSPDIHPHDLGTFLDRQGIAVRTGHHCTMPVMEKLGVPATARASFYIYNTEEEVDQLLDSLRNALRYFSNGSF